MNSTIKEVAKLAGVSTATVSRVINNQDHVSNTTQQKVNSAIKELGYMPNLVAMSLSKQKTQTIGMIVPDVCNSFYSEVFYAASKVAEQYNYRLILFNSDDSVSKETTALQDIISFQMSGLIFTPVSDEDNSNEELIKKMQESGVSVVFLDREMKGVSCDGVYIDNMRGAYDATEILLREGHREIAVIAGQQDTITGRERLTGHINAMQDWNVTYNPKLTVIGDFRADKSYLATLELLNSKNPPTAFFTCNNLMTLGCLRAINETNKRIPQDVAIVGFDKIELLDFLGYKISVLARATTEMGTIGMNLLLDRMKKDDNNSFQRIILQSKLEVYGSEKYMIDQ